MQVSYQYKLRPNQSQSKVMDSWLDMQRSLYNWFLADRIDGYYQTFVMGEYCDIRTKTERYPLSCSLSKNSHLHNPWKNPDKDGLIKKRSASLMQDAYLTELKQARPWYKTIHSNVLQMLIKRLDAAMAGFFQHGRGFPSFKNKSNFRSFQYKPGDVKLNKNKIYLPSIGWMRFFNSRTIPTGFEIRTVTMRKKADGWYGSILIENKEIPNFPNPREINTLISLDMGITKLVHCSDGTDFVNPRPSTSKKSKRTLKIRQRRLSRKKKGSANRKKEAQKVGRLHKKHADKRNAYQWFVANKIVRKADAVSVEDLNIKGMKAKCKPQPDDVKQGRFLKNGQSQKRGLNRSISDASWGTLIEKIQYTAAKSGKSFFKVDPKNTSRTCSKCGVIDALSRFGEKFTCVACGYETHADKQAAVNIKNRTIQQNGLNIKKLKKVRRDSAEPKQLKLFETPTVESTMVKRKQYRASDGKRGVPGNSPTQLSLWDIGDLA
ncbi:MULTISPECIES: RNA-guided endonuclease InsQ/TnpB family protein [Nostocales]|uniref:Transposase n=3 Tax=Nostocales TaxID=1161 RepID=A0A0C1QTJ2_9CYAN|nr:RNA-guided endonuclease TnpB family protein [Tolypothrix bouteillei]KAF3885593.1 transposase [Tolypothrix bouteillei VB521301]